ncbi:MAG: hypothetical protein AAB970_00185 [Patescibacteria group bacterium]
MKSVLNSPRFLELKKKKRKIFIKKILFLICFFILILVGLSFLSKWEYININNIQITGNKVIETKMIESVVKEKIAGNHLWFFPKTNFLLYPRGEIKKELADKFKRLKDISLNIQNFKTLNISLTERTALYTYCGLAPAELDASNQKCYFVDNSGYIFDEAPYFSGEVYLKFYGKTDSYFFQPNFNKLISFKETLQKIGVKPVVFFVEDNGDMKVFLSSTTSQLGPFINLKADTDFNQVIENLQSVLTTEPLKTEFKTKYSSLLYIDLRFGNKVYYKLK